MTRPTIFLSYADKDGDAAKMLHRLLAPDADVVRWSVGGPASGWTALETLTRRAEDADFAVFFLPSEDTLDAAARSNVLFELGFLAGRLGAQRVFLVHTGHRHLQLPSDLHGWRFLGPRVPEAAAAIRRDLELVGPRRDDALQFYSCFLSYAYEDKAFAQRIYDDLQEVGVRCWLDAHQIKAGDRIYDAIDRAIRVHDKLLLILSERSVRSEWVRKEMEIALGLEKAGSRTVLFPLRVDDAVFGEGPPSIKRLVGERHIADFTNWTDSGAYRASFSRLIRDLTIQASVESGETR